MTMTSLDALLIFLSGHKGLSGYDIRQLFQATPLSIFSDSPGAIYPALARLEARGLLSSSVERGGRRKRVYARSKEGEAALREWLVAPLDHDALAHPAQELDLRFVITAEVISWAAAKAFVARCAALYAADLQRLEDYRDGPGQHMPRASRAALDLGIRSTKTRLKWCRDITANKGVGR